MTEKQELERKIILQQQAIQAFQDFTNPIGIETCRDRIRTYRRRLWEIENARYVERVAA